MNCNIIEDLLPSYLDGACSEETKQLVEEHLAQCSACQTLIEELLQEEQKQMPAKPEKKTVLHKIKLHYWKRILMICFVSFLLFLLFGTRCSSMIMKWRMEQYVAQTYPELSLTMKEFSYEDPEELGFGIDNGYYSASFSSPTQSDLAFVVYTEGFFFQLKDTYEAQVLHRNTTLQRLLDEYQKDVQITLSQAWFEKLIDQKVSLATTDMIYEEQLADQLRLQQPYVRSIQDIIPISLTLRLYEEVPPEDVNSYVNQIYTRLKENGFTPAELHLILQTKDGAYEIRNINGQKPFDQQTLIVEPVS